MSTVAARHVASTPVRTAAETWEIIVAILAPDPQSDAHAELVKAAGVASSAISSESTKDAAFVVWGGGTRVRVYCVFGDDAITGDGVNEDALAESPTTGDWQMSIPCPPEDVSWSQGKLAALSSRITARSAEENVSTGSSAAATNQLSVNLEEFLKP